MTTLVAEAALAANGAAHKARAIATAVIIFFIGLSPKFY
jgi:hypothetical protein